MPSAWSDLWEGPEAPVNWMNAAASRIAALGRWQQASLAGGLRRELAPSGVAVTCLLPGATDTEFAERAGIESAMLFNFPLARALGLVQSATTVARTALDGLAAKLEQRLAARAGTAKFALTPFGGVKPIAGSSS